MDKENAIKYLKRKEVDATNEEIEKVMKHGKVYGDPVAVCY